MEQLVGFICTRDPRSFSSPFRPESMSWAFETISGVQWAIHILEFPDDLLTSFQNLYVGLVFCPDGYAKDRKRLHTNKKSDVYCETSTTYPRARDLHASCYSPRINANSGVMQRNFIAQACSPPEANLPKQTSQCTFPSPYPHPGP